MKKHFITLSVLCVIVLIIISTVYLLQVPKKSLHLQISLVNQTNVSLTISLIVNRSGNGTIYEKIFELNGSGNFTTGDISEKGNYVVWVFVDSNRTITRDIIIDEYHGRIGILIQQHQLEFSQEVA